MPQEIISPAPTVKNENHNGSTPYAYLSTNGTIMVLAKMGGNGAIHFFALNKSLKKIGLDELNLYLR